MYIQGVKIRKARTKMKLSQSALASELNVSQKTIWDWENRNCNIKLEYFIKLIKILELNFSDADISDDESQTFINSIIQKDTFETFSYYRNIIHKQNEIIADMQKRIQLLENLLYKQVHGGGGGI